MESKTARFAMMGIGGALVIAGIGLYIFLASESDDEIADIESKDDIYMQL